MMDVMRLAPACCPIGSGSDDNSHEANLAGRSGFGRHAVVMAGPISASARQAARGRQSKCRWRQPAVDAQRRDATERMTRRSMSP